MFEMKEHPWPQCIGKKTEKDKGGVEKIENNREQELRATSVA